ncbi:uncharacterized protein LOC114331861 isoform X1 [Diabrotica virgifera virgifera]|uniref:Uncharacterized protein LOC114331861 isoform X1 n=2 Tax=Diabrotica virgifera virgifera TaxID=50390 RepID=A0A6P7FXQ7_DIAVI|nr:uncharacterized protein LOC114331861 isoform X1 [Diabrotica virgifera virgifera]
MISSILSRLVILLIGTLYPAYASYKAVRTKNVREYVKWMMYWIVFALFTCVETFTDVFFSWFPFYYEVKIILVIWLLSPATKGSSILYRKFVHPTLSSREQEIDEYISKAKEQSYRQVLDIGSKGVSALMQTAIKGGGGLVNQLRKSYSLSDLSDPAHDDVHDEADTITEPHVTRRRRSPHRSSSTSVVYFAEVDVRPDRVAAIQSAEDISSSGYSSGEGLPLKVAAREGLQRTGSLTRSRSTRVTRSTVPKKSGASDESDENEEFDTNVVFHKDTKGLPKLDEKTDSSSENEFLDSLDVVHDNVDDGINNLNINSKGTQIITACEENVDISKFELSTNVSLQCLSSNEKDLNIESNPDILQITKDVGSFSAFLKNLIETKNDSENIDKDKIENPNINLDNSDREIIKPRTKKLLEQVITSNPDSRGGKYNKKHAPLPPPSATHPIKPASNSLDSENTSLHDSTPSIKATLVLKPGLVRSVGSAESICKDVFLQPPKPKRTLLNRSRTSLSSTSSSSSKSKSPFSKLIKFPKKIGFWNKDNDAEKRSSWHSYMSQDYLKPLSDSKLQSKSDNDLLRTHVNATPPHAVNLTKGGSQLSLRTLKESPLASRRIKIIRRYVDEDID